MRITDRERIERFLDVMRAHMEYEIHGLFVPAEECFTDERLRAVANWHAEHVAAAAEAETAAIWPERWLG